MVDLSELPMYLHIWNHTGNSQVKEGSKVPKEVRLQAAEDTPL